MLFPVSQLRYVARATVSDRRVRRVQSRTPVPSFLSSGFTLRVFARGPWLAGGFQWAVNLRGRSCVVSRFGRLRPVPCGLEWLRFVVVYVLAGPSGGRQSELQVSWTLSFRTGYAESIELLFNSKRGRSELSEDQSLPFCAPSPWFSGSPAWCSLSSRPDLHCLQRWGG